MFDLIKLTENQKQILIKFIETKTKFPITENLKNYINNKMYYSQYVYISRLFNQKKFNKAYKILLEYR